MNRKSRIYSEQFLPQFSLKAHAKINWLLRILNKRKDGYHNIFSLMQCVTIYDTLLFEHSDKIELISNLSIPPKKNLVYKAIDSLKKSTSCRKGVKITLHKNIPISAGLGGGSSDAACTLRGLNILWGLGLKIEELNTIGINIGSDVPFFLNNTFAVVEGRGEKITPLEIKSKTNVILLVKPDISISTKWAYSLYNNKKRLKLTKQPLDIKLICCAFSDRKLNSIKTKLTNDLEKVVSERYPIINKIKEILLKNGAIFTSMSGSGPTVFGVFETKKKAQAVARKIGANYWCKVTETIN